ncbi:hypothetical protein TNIN_486621 [Trichonephila inaurata madagascariensis]|uniref:Uncharacterized protein n=1 Tax=Trichonephila inaurata madagascariensis TaxID=2747483 RepID=A0A8X7CFD5_9ARAC|nr:hypothetical protein TNIN_486621 [Trichonephila inaurata madagascariensis]
MRQLLRNSPGVMCNSFLFMVSCGIFFSYPDSHEQGSSPFHDKDSQPLRQQFKGTIDTSHRKRPRKRTYPKSPEKKELSFRAVEQES